MPANPLPWAALTVLRESELGRLAGYSGRSAVILAFSKVLRTLYALTREVSPLFGLPCLPYLPCLPVSAFLCAQTYLLAATRLFLT